MSEQVTPEWAAERWLELPAKMRREVVDHARGKIPSSTWDQVRSAIDADPDSWWVAYAYHFGWGMSFRNLMREVVADVNLPFFDEGRHWDDYWVQAAEAAAGRREVGDGRS
jgi:hypothetical protein